MKRITLVPFAMLLLSSSAAASSLCVQASLSQYIQDYVGYSNACSVGDKLFYDFSFSSSASSGTAPRATALQIVPDAGDGVSNPGFLFSGGAFLVFPGRSIDATLIYSVATMSGQALIEGYSLSIAGSHNGQGNGFGTVTESFSNSPAGTPLITSIGPADGTVLSAGVNGLPLASGTIVTTTLHVESPAGSSDIVTLSAIQEHFSEISSVPEPYQPVLIGSGLLVLGLWRRRRAR